MKENKMRISLFGNIKQTTNGSEISVIEFLDGLRNGTWRKEVEFVRNEPEKRRRIKLKEDTLPYVTISGTFDRRSDKGLKKHSSLICIDMDEINDLAEIKDKLKNDPYTYVIFTSVTGKGLAVIVKIEPEKHIESFLGLEMYYFEKYSIRIDKSCKDVSRARFVSYDPDLLVNPESMVFKDYIEKEVETKEAKSALIIKGEKDLKELEELTAIIEHMIKQIEEKKIILGDDSYNDWFKIGCALSDGLGEEGRKYFHRVSVISSKYDKEDSDKQYNACLNGSKPGNKITISTFFHYTKKAGLVANNGTLPYFINEEGYLCRRKLEKNGNESIVRLANFDGEITKEIVKDNGLDQINYYTLNGKIRGTSLKEIQVPALAFNNMNWVCQWGSRAVMEPGLAVKDCVRHYIQLNSNAYQEVCYMHTGWRKVDNKWVYLTGSGAIGAENISVELSREMQRYRLPLEINNERAAIDATLSILKIGNEKITYPLFALLYLTPLTTILNPMPNFSGYIYGETGTFKTTLAMLLLSHMGDFVSINTLPNFSDTANNIEKRAFVLKDNLMVLDDYHPSSQRYDAQSKENIAQRIIRAFSNRTGRGRLNPDGTDKGHYEPRGMLLITGEEFVTLQSTQSRTMVVEIHKGDIEKSKLKLLQEKSCLLPHAMTSYILWIKENYEDIKKRFTQRFSELRDSAFNETVHGKLPEQVAFLTFSLEVVTSWLCDKGMVTIDKAEKIVDGGKRIFTKSVSAQTQRIKNEDPVYKFQDILQTLITQEKVRLEDKNNKTDKTEEGWIKHYEFLGGRESELIGYFDREWFYLLSSAVWRIVFKFSAESGVHFPVTKSTLLKMLKNRNLIETKDGENIILCKIQGRNRRALKILRSNIHEGDGK